MQANQIEELLVKIEKLSLDIEKYQQEISLLKEQVLQLTGPQPLLLKNPSPKSAPAKPVIFDFENFIGLNLIHFIGIIVLIIGLSIGVKYAIDVNLVSPAVRIISAYLTGAVLFFISLKLLRKYELFSMILFSGAMVSIYFTTYAAFEYYALLPRSVAFMLMLFITVFTVYTSLKYNRKEIAILGLVGAYGIPFFVGKNSGDISSLFSYVFLINVGILFISFRKYWVLLTYLSFFTTWLIFFSSLIAHTGKPYFNVEILFAVIFFALFLVNCLIFKFMKRQALSIPDTFLIIANTGLLYFSFAILYAGNNEVYMENITSLFGVIYMIMGIFSKKYLSAQPYFSNALFSVSLTAFIIYIPMKYEGLTVTIIWVLMAILYFVIGMFCRIKSFRIAAILLFAVTLSKLLFIDSNNFTSVEKIIAYVFTGIVLLIVSFLYQKFGKRIFINSDI